MMSLTISRKWIWVHFSTSVASVVPCEQARKVVTYRSTPVGERSQLRSKVLSIERKNIPRTVGSFHGIRTKIRERNSPGNILSFDGEDFNLYTGLEERDVTCKKYLHV
jgi:hypothetical protein